MSKPTAVASLRNQSRASLLRASTQQAMVGWRGRDQLNLSFAKNSFGSGLRAGSSLNVLAQGSAALVGEQSSTSLHQSIGEQMDFALTAIVARSRYATPGMGTSPWQSVEQFSGVRQSGVQEVSEGGGVQLSLDRKLSDRLSFNVALQSRLDLDAFKSYRGIYSEAGDFDLPGFARTGIEWAISDRFAVGADVQRVMYSEVETFTAASLPTRFLALLGDGSSPEFAWEDLTVYSAEAAVLDDFGGRWSLRYSTQQQPRPTSAVLSRALSDQYSDLNIGFGYNRALGRSGHFELSASYVPAAYFLVSAPFLQRDFDGGSQVEVEAQWSLAF
ncbi:MAG: hypothetical protein ACT4NL_12915 [Pseudomarimonas sp.]